MNHLYIVEWSYDGETKTHLTSIECEHKSVKCALSEFKRFYKWSHKSSCVPFNIVSVEYRKEVIKKCW